MNENDTIKDLLNQARNTRHLVDKVTSAAYGVTMGEIAVNNMSPEVREIYNVLVERPEIMEIIKLYQDLDDQGKARFWEMWNQHMEGKRND